MKKSELRKIIKEQIRLLNETDTICGDVMCQCTYDSCMGTYCYHATDGPLAGVFECSCCECFPASPTIDNKDTLNVTPTTPIVSPTDSSEKIRKTIREAIKHNHITEQTDETFQVMCNCANADVMSDPFAETSSGSALCFGTWDSQSGIVDCSCCDSNCAPVQDKLKDKLG